MSSPEIVQPVSEQGLSEPARIINTFVAPSKTFDDIRRNASWWVPWILTAIVSCGYLFVMDAKIGWERAIQNQIEQSPKAMERMEKATPEQREQGLAIQIKVSKVLFQYGGWVFGLIAGVIVAAVLMATFNFGFGAEVKFGAALAIVMYSWLPAIARALLGIITILAGTDPEGFNIKNAVATNAAYFMTPGSHPFFYGVAQTFDVISIWIVFLLALGFSRNSKVKLGTAFAVVFGIYLVVNIGGAAIGAAFS